MAYMVVKKPTSSQHPPLGEVSRLRTFLKNLIVIRKSTKSLPTFFVNIL